MEIRWHAHPGNMQEVKSFTGYFSKYLGKDEQVKGDFPGRWWGSFNKAGLPAAPSVREPITTASAICLHRLARKRKQIKRGKHASRSTKLERFGCLNVTPVQLWRLRSGYDLDRFRNPEQARFLPGFHRFAVGFIRAPGTSPIVLCGSHVPAFVKQAPGFANRMSGIVETPFQSLRGNTARSGKIRVSS